jgi:hypothetical protein
MMTEGDVQAIRARLDDVESRANAGLCEPLSEYELQLHSDLRACLDALAQQEEKVKTTRESYQRTLTQQQEAMSAVIAQQEARIAEEHHPNCEVSRATCTCDNERVFDREGYGQG